MRESDAVTFNVKWIDNVMIDQFEVFVANPMLDITFATGEEVVSDDHFMALQHQSIDQVRTHKTRCSTRDEFIPYAFTILPGSASHLQIQRSSEFTIDQYSYTYQNTFTIFVRKECYFGILLLPENKNEGEEANELRLLTELPRFVFAFRGPRFAHLHNGYSTINYKRALLSRVQLFSFCLLYGRKDE